MPSEEEWTTLMQKAAEGKYGAPFLEGDLLNGDTNDDRIQFYHQPNEGGALASTEINIYTSEENPVEGYEMLKKESLESKPWRQDGREVDGWKEWPKGFPNQNDYEGVSHCGATADGNKVVWVQGKALVVLFSMAGEKMLKEYVNGVWNVVYAALGK